MLQDLPRGLRLRQHMHQLQQDMSRGRGLRVRRLRHARWLAPVMSVCMVATSCATVDYARIENDHATRLATLEQDFNARRKELRSVRAERLREISAEEQQETVAMEGGELVAPYVDKERRQCLLLCASLEACEALEAETVEAIDTIYANATEQYREAAARALDEFPPSRRVLIYEQLMALGQNQWARSRAEHARKEVEAAYHEAITELVEEYRRGTIESDSLRTTEIAQEEARVERENSETAAAVLAGVATVALIVAASRSGSGGGSTGSRSKTKVICPFDGSDLQGCCSHHGGVDTAASSAYSIMCEDGQQSPTCSCF